MSNRLEYLLLRIKVCQDLRSIKYKLLKSWNNFMEMNLIILKVFIPLSIQILKSSIKKLELCFNNLIIYIKKGLRPRTNLNYAFILYILKCKEKYGNRYNFSDYKGYNKSVNILDSLTGEKFRQNAQDFYEKGKPKNLPKLSDLNFLAEVSKHIQPKGIEYLSYDTLTQKVIFKYNGQIHAQLANEHTKGIAISLKLQINKENFYEKVKYLHNNRFEYSGYINSTLPVTVLDTVTKKKYFQRPKDILAGRLPKKLALSLKRSEKKFKFIMNYVIFSLMKSF